MKHRFTADALSDYESAVAYYETQEPGLGVRFIIDVDELISTATPDGRSSSSDSLAR